MCLRDPGLCRGDQSAGRRGRAGPRITLSPARWRQLVAVNATVNARIRPAQDSDLFGEPDFWTRGGAAGDCDDYMVAKKLMLIEAGWAADQLLYAVVEGQVTAYHAVLIARTDRGDLVLDNLNARVMRWEDTGYRFVIRQSAARPGSGA